MDLQPLIEAVQPRLVDATTRLLELADQDACGHQLSPIEAAHALVGAAAIDMADAIAGVAAERDRPIEISELQEVVNTFDRTLCAQLARFHAPRTRPRTWSQPRSSTLPGRAPRSVRMGPDR